MAVLVAEGRMTWPDSGARSGPCWPRGPGPACSGRLVPLSPAPAGFRPRGRAGHL